MQQDKKSVRLVLTTLCMFLISQFAKGEITVTQAWGEEYAELTRQLKKGVTRGRFKLEALDAQALILKGDKDPIDIVLRRTGALLHFFSEQVNKSQKHVSEPLLKAFQNEIDLLTASANSTTGNGARKILYNKVCRLRRKIVFANPLLDFNSIVCMLENPGKDRIVEQARACFGHSRGGGPVIIQNFKTNAEVIKPLQGFNVTEGAWKGKELTGKFSGLELDYDSSSLIFSATTSSDIWRIFRFNMADNSLVQLTDGPADDFDPCIIPSGRIVFTSTRRGGIGRCLLRPQSLTYTLHSMEPDGSDIVPLSFHETNEWQPSVNNEGMLVYTRWDYLDRWWASAHHLWLSYPDGRDPRNYHGNYPLPWSAMPEGVQPEDYGKSDKRLFNGRVLRPDVEISIRAVPFTSKYTATAVGHHQGFSGSLVLVDTSIPDDGKMGQVKRITPLYPFPEVEGNALHAYGTPWPLSADFYLCNFNKGLYMLDRFGNREIIYDPGNGPFRVRDPFPLKSRKTPPDLAVRTWQGKRSALPGHRRAVISVVNCRDSDMPLPPDIKVKWMRINQVIPQLLTRISSKTIKYISFADESIGRISLGVVPVEKDGSVYCEAPVGKALYFQLLDENGMAVHSMRSVTYVHPGERLSCHGCHEDKWKSNNNPHEMPIAFKRAPSKIVPEVKSGMFPFNFYKLVKRPVFDKKCVSCHRNHPAAPDMSYKSLAKFTLAYGLPGELGMNRLGIGGSRTTPGRFGAHASGIVKSLKTKKYHKNLKLTADEWRRITLWLDLNSNEIGWEGDDIELIAAQKRGEDVWPPIDIDQSNPTGVEKNFPAPGGQ